MCNLVYYYPNVCLNKLSMARFKVDLDTLQNDKGAVNRLAIGLEWFQFQTHLLNLLYNLGLKAAHRPGSGQTYPNFLVYLEPTR